MEISIDGQNICILVSTAKKSIALIKLNNKLNNGHAQPNPQTFIRSLFLRKWQ